MDHVRTLRDSNCNTILQSPLARLSMGKLRLSSCWGAAGHAGICNSSAAKALTASDMVAWVRSLSCDDKVQHYRDLRPWNFHFQWKEIII